MISWAEQECRIACKQENPNYDFDSDDFDYGCSCYKSALKAYNSLLGDGHSGASWEFAKQILTRLLDHHPLTPITDEDFFINSAEIKGEPSEYLKERGLKSSIMCPRMTSLFRDEYLDGRVEYMDVSRSYLVDIERPSDHFYFSDKIIDKMFPITMPYLPRREKYQIYTQSFLTDEKNGDYDTRGILYVITPNGEKVDLNIFTTLKNGKMERIDKEEYDELLAKRIDKLNITTADSLLWTLISNSSPDDKEIERREKAFNKLIISTKERIRAELEEKCKFFDNPDHYKYNTFNVEQALCKGRAEALDGIPELIDIMNFLQDVLKMISPHN